LFSDKPVVLKGVISNYSAVRHRRDFQKGFSSEGLDAAVAIGAALTGNSATALGVMRVEDPTARADWVEFSIDGKMVKGWIWSAPFGDGDVVEVVAHPQGEMYSLVAICREKDGVVALYPHVIYGRSAYIKRLIRCAGVFFLVLFFVWVALLSWVMSGSYFDAMVSSMGINLAAIIFTVATVGAWARYITMRSFCVMAEKIFDALGWENVKKINLKKTSKLKAVPLDKQNEEYGEYYFKR
jgi:hypothetical protein